MSRPYLVVDAFSDRPLRGNPVAVIFNAEGLSDEAMQSIASWTNLSETTFILPSDHPEADYRLRIFTPASELAFAGHPTLGSAKAILDRGLFTPRHGRLVQSCQAGLVPIEISGEGPEQGLTLELPQAGFKPLGVEATAALSQAYGTASLSDFIAVDVGIIWGVAQVGSVETLLALDHDLNAAAALERQYGLTGVSLFAIHEDGSLEVRSFAVADGVPEDPVCGSGNGAIAAYRRHLGQLPATNWSYTARQGRCVNRDGHVSLSCDAEGRIKVGGRCVVTVRGVLHL